MELELLEGVAMAHIAQASVAEQVELLEAVAEVTSQEAEAEPPRHTLMIGMAIFLELIHVLEEAEAVQDTQTPQSLQMYPDNAAFVLEMDMQQLR